MQMMPTKMRPSIQIHLKVWLTITANLLTPPD